jgi:hypothetical protein
VVAFDAAPVPEIGGEGEVTPAETAQTTSSETSGESAEGE